MIAFETERTDPTEWTDEPPKFGYRSRRDKEDPSYKYGIVWPGHPVCRPL
jgi:hypothetical protein